MHYHTTDSVQTIVSKHIWIKIGIVLGILIIFEKSRLGKSCMRISISGRQIDDFRRLSSVEVTGWGGWRAGRRWSRRWSPHSASGRGRGTCSFASPACLRIICGAILARKAAGRLVMTKHCRRVFVLQPSPFYAQETQHPASSLFGPRRVVS